MTDFEQALPSVTIKVVTPDGTLYVTVIDDENGNPTRIDATIGKAGSRLSAWVNALSRLLTFLVKRGFTTRQLVSELAGIRSDNVRMHGDTEIGSGPEGFAKALIMYEEFKYKNGNLAR